MRHPLTDAHDDGRRRLLDLGRALAGDGSTPTTACPGWTVKDVYAHLAGISTDILAGNTERAATVEWADGHVADRADQSLVEVLDEWERAGSEVSDVMAAFGDAFPFQLFIDQFTHEWDIRSAIGPAAAAEPDGRVYAHCLDQLSDSLVQRGRERDLSRLDVAIDDHVVAIGDGDRVGELPLSLFEFARVTMGRRSRRQLGALPWPMEDIDGHIEALVVWSVNGQDVDDPIT